MISWGACSGPIIHVFHYMSLQIIIIFFLEKNENGEGERTQRKEERRKGERLEGRGIILSLGNPVNW